MPHPTRSPRSDGTVTHPTCPDIGSKEKSDIGTHDPISVQNVTRYRVPVLANLNLKTPIMIRRPPKCQAARRPVGLQESRWNSSDHHDPLRPVTIKNLSWFSAFNLKFNIWNPDHLDKNGQNGTYVAEHGTDMFVHVHKVTYNSEHVCTCYVHVQI